MKFRFKIILAVFLIVLGAGGIFLIKSGNKRIALLDDKHLEVSAQATLPAQSSRDAQAKRSSQSVSARLGEGPSETDQPVALPSSKPKSEAGTSGLRGGYRIVKQDESGMTLEIDVPPYQIDSFEAGGEIYQKVSIPGYFPLEKSGQPTLPAKVITVPVPGVESVDVQIISSEKKGSEPVNLFIPYFKGWSREEVEAIWQEMRLENPQAASQISPRWKEFWELRRRARNDRAQEEVGGGVALPSEISRGEEVYPGEIVQPGSLYWRRDQQFINLLINPFEYSGLSGTLSLHSPILVELKYGPPVRTLGEEGQVDYGEQFKLARSDSFKVFVASDGIHTITKEDLEAAGFNTLADPRALKMYFQGKEISIFIEGEEDGFWDQEDYIDFYGEKNTGFYSQTNVYWLYQDTLRGKRMEEVSSPPCGRPSRQEHFLSPRHLEEVAADSYSPFLPVEEGNSCWFWDSAGFAYGFDYPVDLTFEISGVSDRQGTVPFIGRFFGWTEYEAVNPDHHTRVYLNNQLIADFLWDGQVEYLLETDLPQGYFNEGLNTIKIEEVDDLGLPTPMDFVLIRNFDVSYYQDYLCENDRLRFSASKKGDYCITGFNDDDDDDIVLYDITDPSQPRKITDINIDTGPSRSLRFRKSESGQREYIALCGSVALSPWLEENQPSDLDRPRLVDYIVITHPDFSAAVQSLVDFRDERENGGLRVGAFEIQEVYDTFSFGNFDPHAIKRFLQYAYYSWKKPSPSYILLVGDGHYDYKDYQGDGVSNYIPPYLFQSYYMETASDNWYACIVGEDDVPDMHIGRFSVHSATEAEDLVQKIIDYENGTSGHPWQEKVLMVADDPSPGAADFPADSDWLIADYIPSPYVADTAYKPDLNGGTTAAIINAINDGRLIVNYLGHGSVTTWSSSPTIFSNANIPSLNNWDRLPLMTNMTCMNGYWCDVVETCLAEAMVNAVGKGSIASLSGSGMCLNTVSKLLAAYLFEELLINGHKEIGPAITEAKSLLAGVAPFEELDLYHLFGDPALTLK